MATGIETQLLKDAEIAQRAIDSIMKKMDKVDWDDEEIIDQCYMIDEAIRELMDIIFRKTQD